MELLHHVGRRKWSRHHEGKRHLACDGADKRRHVFILWAESGCEYADGAPGLRRDARRRLSFLGQLCREVGHLHKREVAGRHPQGWRGRPQNRHGSDRQHGVREQNRRCRDSRRGRLRPPVPAFRRRCRRQDGAHRRRFLPPHDGRGLERRGRPDDAFRHGGRPAGQLHRRQRRVRVRRDALDVRKPLRPHAHGRRDAHGEGNGHDLAAERIRCAGRELHAHRGGDARLRRGRFACGLPGYG